MVSVLSLAALTVGSGTAFAAGAVANAKATLSTPRATGSKSVQAAKTKKPVDAARLMEALSLIESGDRDDAVGKAGEVSRYQIMPFVWRKYKGGNPRNHADARRVAVRILTDRIQEFQQKHRRDPSLVETYALWRSPARAMQLRLSSSVQECGNRFATLASIAIDG